MPGKPITDQQMRLYVSERVFHGQLIAATRAGFSERIGRRVEANHIGCGYSFEALCAKMQLSEGSETKTAARPASQNMLSRDPEMVITVHSMRVPTHYEGRYVTLLSTPPEILRDGNFGSDQS